MKTTITLAVLALLSIGNVFGKDQLYKNVETNSEARTITTTVCKGANDTYLSPTKRYVVTLDLNNNPIKKTIFVWNSESSTWVDSQKYNYDYTTDGQLIYLAFAKWNEVTASWTSDVEYTIHLNDESNTKRYLTIE